LEIDTIVGLKGAGNHNVVSWLKIDSSNTLNIALEGALADNVR
jgi:hypothetical protein